jgi:D-arabinose 1-dehydrogenase-like Zn-dependent alcohol dehydrogenase
MNLVVVHDATPLCCTVTRLNGTEVQLSRPPEVKIPYPKFIFKGMKVIGSLICSASDTRSVMFAVKKHGMSSRVEVFHGWTKSATPSTSCAVASLKARLSSSWTRSSWTRMC